MDEPFHPYTSIRGNAMRITARTTITAAVALVVAASLAGCTSGFSTTTAPAAAVHTDTTYTSKFGGGQSIKIVQIAKTTSTATKAPICVVGVEFTVSGTDPQDPAMYQYALFKPGAGLFSGPVAGAKASSSGSYALLDGWPITYDGGRWYYSEGKLADGTPSSPTIAAGTTGRLAYAAKCSDLSSTAKIEDASADPTVYKTFDATWK